MNFVVAPSPFMSLSAVIHALRGALGGWAVRGMLSAALGLLLYRRLGEICGRMERLAARFQAGRLWRIEGRRGASGHGAVAEGTRERAARIWPGRFGWLVRLASYHAVAYGSQLRVVLAQPEMVALLEASPQAVRILRPLCRMLAVEASVLRPGQEAAIAEVAPAEKAKRVRKPRPKVDWGRIPIPRGVLTWARREGFGKVPRE